MNVNRTQSIRYVGDEDAPELRFASLDRGGVDDDDYHKNENILKIWLLDINKIILKKKN